MELFPWSRICLTGGAVATRSAPHADCRQRLGALPWLQLSALKHSLSIYLLERLPRGALIAINSDLEKIQRVLRLLMRGMRKMPTRREMRIRLKAG
ncbi:MAG: hypothetical protein BGO65_14275 [Afipia sp. 64-13]|nr:MAG: hypothetical protein BGO65_14275 [Afipia sp. 64-13]